MACFFNWVAFTNKSRTKFLSNYSWSFIHDVFYEDLYDGFITFLATLRSGVTHSKPIFIFYTPWKRHKTSDFLKFFREHWNGALVCNALIKKLIYISLLSEALMGVCRRIDYTGRKQNGIMFQGFVSYNKVIFITLINKSKFKYHPKTAIKQ